MIEKVQKCCIPDCASIEVDPGVIRTFFDAELNRANGRFLQRIGFSGPDIFSTHLAHHLVNGDVVKMSATIAGTLYVVQGPIQTSHKGADPNIETYWMLVGDTAKFQTAGLI